MLRCFLVFICLVCTQLMPAEAKRVALVIGNAKYSTVGVLFTPQRDVPLIEKALRESGFEDVDVRMDLGLNDLTTALREFSDKASDAEVALVYYAGHGIEISNTNYLIPIDAMLKKAKDAGFEAIDLALVRKAVSGASKLRMVVLDACRNNPFPLESKDGTRAPRKIGLVEIKPSFNEYIAFSAQQGVVADDGPSDGNSPFAAAFAKWLVEPGMEIRFVMGHVRDEVVNSTGTTEEREGPQIPYVEGSLGGEQIVFKPAVNGEEKIGAKDAQAQAAFVAAGENLSMLNSVANRFEGTVWADFAKAKILEMEKKVAVLVPPKPPEPECAGVLSTVQGETRCLKPGDAFTDCVNCPEMVVVPAGSFMMGSPTEEEDRQANEGPQHKVTLRNAFAVGRFEVTRGQFAAFVKETKYATGSSCWIWNGTEWKDTAGKSFKDTGFKQTDEHPVACVSWDDAQAYIKWLSKKSGIGYRLLTEAEWEYANRADTNTAFPTGATITTAQANFNIEKSGTTPIGTYAENKFGLFDMAGNVWEWTEDCYEDSYKNADAGGKATQGSSCKRVFRGGGWDLPPQFLRSAFRLRSTTDNRNINIGFRLARTF